MKVLVADKLPPSGLAAFEEAGFELVADASLKDDALLAAAREHAPQVLVVRSTKVPRPVLEVPSLELVVRAGAGFNNVDVAAASQLGVYVANCPGKNAVAVAELTWGLLVGLDRRIPDCTRDLRAGQWKKKVYGKAAGLLGRTLGVVGLGEIGRQVVQRAKAFGMPVVAWSRSLTEEGAQALGVERVESPVEVARRGYAVSVHVALTDETRGLCDREFFAAMEPGSLFINTSRGAVVDGEALAWAVQEHGIRAGLDVWNQQPSDALAEFTDPLAQLEGVIGTHHIGASTAQAQDAVAAEAVRVARVYKETSAVPNCVNMAVRSPAPCALVVLHEDRVGVLAHVLQELKKAEINVQEMQNVLFTGEGAAACATIRVSSRPSDELLTSLRGHEPIIDVKLTE